MVINSSNYKAIARARKAAEPLVLHYTGTTTRTLPIYDSIRKKMVDSTYKIDMYKECIVGMYSNILPGAVTITTNSRKLQQLINNQRRQQPEDVVEVSRIYAADCITYEVAAKIWGEIREMHEEAINDEE